MSFVFFARDGPSLLGTVAALFIYTRVNLQPTILSCTLTRAGKILAMLKNLIYRQLLREHLRIGGVYAECVESDIEERKDRDHYHHADNAPEHMLATFGARLVVARAYNEHKATPEKIEKCRRKEECEDGIDDRGIDACYEFSGLFHK